MYLEGGIYEDEPVCDRERELLTVRFKNRQWRIE